MIDLQVNGAGGVSFASAPTVDGYRRAAADLAVHGTDGFLATVPTAAPDAYEPIVEAAAAAVAAGVPGLLGLHLEGPFLSPERRGAHVAAWLRAPEAAWLVRLCELGPRGLVRLVTLAPELPGALEVVAACRELGIVVSVGHSTATPDQAGAAAPDMVTHLFNGMEPFHHRNPGLSGYALAEPGVVCGLICDGVHVHPRALRIAFAAKGPDGIALVSDAVAGPGRLADGTLAGATVFQDAGVETCVAAGIARKDALAAGTTTPARLLAGST